ncbi:hypothetical protein EKD04_017215 [Chloroflexales bacterium ZM16-3]|nr:hypothetical protein [Chloroflexales bacterium ZM16-3]
MPTANRTFTWRKTVPQELAQFAMPDLSEHLRWPPYISRLDLLANEGRASVVRQFYQQLLGLKLIYEVTPFDPLDSDVQQIRRPSEILASRVGTCVDLTLLMAGMCLAADLLPLVVVLDGHALLAVSLTKGRAEARNLPHVHAFENGLLRNIDHLRTWADDEAYLLVECTGVAASQGGLSPQMPEGAGRDRHGYMSFDRACAAGLEQIAQRAVAKNVQAGTSQRTFLFAAHVHELQQRGFKPLSDADPPEVIDQSGHNNFGQVGTIEQFIAGDYVDGDTLTFAGLSGAEIAEALRRMNERHQIWNAQVATLCAMQLGLSVEAIFYTQSATWNLPQTVDMDAESPLELFRLIVQKRYNDRPSDRDSLLVFVCALACSKLISTDDQRRLHDWVDTTIERLAETPAARVRHTQQTYRQADDIAAQAERYAHEPFSLLIDVAPSRDDRYTLQVRIFHPADIEANPLDSTTADFTADELRQELNVIRRKLPSWIRSSEGGLLFEFLLPFDLLAELEAGAWKLTDWLFEVKQRSPADLPLGQLHPIIARCSDRTSDEERQWTRRWRQFERWLSDRQPEIAPLLTCLNDDHACYVCYEKWQTENRLVGVVIDALPDPAIQWDGIFEKILESGLPVALWPAPRPEGAALPSYSEAILQDQSARLGNLPREIWERRKNPAMAHEVAGLVLFWDNYDRQPRQVPFQAPQ